MRAWQGASSDPGVIDAGRSLAEQPGCKSRRERGSRRLAGKRVCASVLLSGRSLLQGMRYPRGGGLSQFRRSMRQDWVLTPGRPEIPGSRRGPDAAHLHALIYTMPLRKCTAPRRKLHFGGRFVGARASEGSMIVNFGKSRGVWCALRRRGVAPREEMF